jgi:hypothetical protein
MLEQQSKRSKISLSDPIWCELENGKLGNSNDAIEENWSGREDLNLRPPGPELKEHNGEE